MTGSPTNTEKSKVVNDLAETVLPSLSFVELATVERRIYPLKMDRMHDEGIVGHPAWCIEEHDDVHYVDCSTLSIEVDSGGLHVHAEANGGSPQVKISTGDFAGLSMPVRTAAKLIAALATVIAKLDDDWTVYVPVAGQADMIPAGVRA